MILYNNATLNIDSNFFKNWMKTITYYQHEQKWTNKKIYHLNVHIKQYIHNFDFICNLKEKNAKTR